MHSSDGGERALGDFWREVRHRFPGAADLADDVHRRQWDEVEPDLAFLWFESLAQAMNMEMSRAVAPERYLPLFEFLSARFASGPRVVRNCIDVAFVENLFWGVTSQHAEPYWLALSKRLRELYLAFHRRAPC